MFTLEEIRDQLSDDALELVTSDDVTRTGCDMALRELSQSTDTDERRKLYYRHCSAYWAIDNPGHELNRLHNGYVTIMEHVLGIPFLENGGGLDGLRGIAAS